MAKTISVRAPKITTTRAQDVVLLQSAGIGIVTTLGHIRTGEGINAKGMIGAGVLAVGLMGVAALDGELAIGIGTIALVSSTLATIAGKNLGDLAFDQLGKIGDKIPEPGPSRQAEFERVGAVGNAFQSATDDVADGVLQQAPTPGGFAKPLQTDYSKPGPHGSARNAFGGDAVDIMAPEGTPVYAVQSGRIGKQFGSLGADSSSVYGGKRLHLYTGDGNQWYYAHLKDFASGIKPGARVRAGQLLGFVGKANNVAHLHLEDKYQTVRRRV